MYDKTLSAIWPGHLLPDLYSRFVTRSLPLADYRTPYVTTWFRDWYAEWPQPCKGYLAPQNHQEFSYETDPIVDDLQVGIERYFE